MEKAKPGVKKIEIFGLTIYYPKTKKEGYKFKMHNDRIYAFTFMVR